MRRAVLVDPYPLWLDGVAAALEVGGFGVVARCARTADALELVAEHQPDLCVTEIAGTDPGEYIKGIRAAGPATRVIILTAVEDLVAVGTALAAGAAAYVMKTAAPEDFGAAVTLAFSPSVFLSGGGNGASSDGDDAGTPGTDAIPSLTKREIEILRLVAEGASNASVAKKLWITEQTVKFHLSNVYKKIGAANRTEAARWAQQNGVLEGRPGGPQEALAP